MHYECDNCGHTGDEGSFPAARDLEQRLDENGPATSKECPECGALAYLIDPAEFLPVLRTSREEIAEALRAQGKAKLAEQILATSNSDAAYIVRKIGDRFTDLLADSYSDVLVAETESYLGVSV
jgi:rRNA maturation protein Nop10